MFCFYVLSLGDLDYLRDFFADAKETTARVPPPNMEIIEMSCKWYVVIPVSPMIRLSKGADTIKKKPRNATKMPNISTPDSSDIIQSTPYYDHHLFLENDNL